MNKNDSELKEFWGTNNEHLLDRVKNSGSINTPLNLKSDIKTKILSSNSNQKQSNLEPLFSFFKPLQLSITACFALIVIAVINKPVMENQNIATSKNSITQSIANEETILNTLNEYDIDELEIYELKEDLFILEDLV